MKTASVNQTSFVGILSSMTLLLVLINIIDELLGRPSWQIHRILYLGYESNLPTWFSSSLFFMAAILAFHCGLFAHVKKKAQFMWMMLAFVLMLWSCDETAMIHEHLGQTIHRNFFPEAPLVTEWVIILGPFILISAVVFMWKFNKHVTLAPDAKSKMLLGVMFLIIGAFLLEALWNIPGFKDLPVYIKRTQVILEETFEFMGILCILDALLKQHKLLYQSRIRHN